MAQRELNILIRAKDEASRAIGGIEGKLKDLEPQFKKISAVGAVGLGIVTAGAMNASKQAGLAEGAWNKFNTVFGDGADEMTKWVGELRKEMPMASHEIVRMSADLQDLLVPMGIARDEASGMTKQTVELANKIAAFNDVDPSEVLDAMKSGFTGMSQPLKRFGIDASVSALEARAIRDGLIEAGDTFAKLDPEVRKSVQAQALLAQAYDNSSDAIEGFEDNQDSYLWRMNELKASMEDMRVSIGEALMPVLDALVQKISPIIERVVEWVKENQTLVKNFVLITGAVLGIMAVMYPFIKVVQGLIVVIKALKFVTMLFNATLWASPITWIIAGIVLLIAILWVLWSNWEEISNWLAEKMEWIRLKFDEALNWIASKVQWVADTITSIWETVTNWISSKIDVLKNAFGTLRDWVVGIFKTVGDTIKGAFRATVNWVIDGINKLISRVNNISSKLNSVPGVNIPIIPDIPRLAKGGIVNKPTLAMIGEDGAEAVVPLNKKNNPMYGEGGGLTINIYGDVSGQDIVEKVGEKIMGQMRLNGQMYI